MEGHNTGLPPLEEPCTVCGGTGEAPPAPYGQMRESFYCPTCKGHKVAPTEAGKQLIDFMKRRFGLGEKEAHRSRY